MRFPFSKQKPRGSGVRDLTAPVPDERVWGRHYEGPAPWVVGLVMVGIIAIGVYFAFAKELPWASPSYELSATFDNAVNIRESNPVRIAGVKVGEVTKVEPDGGLAKVTFSVDESGQPIHEDAQIEIRPRLFLEGNFFLDVTPGSPSADELPDGGEIPVTQTATAVQIDEVLTSLQQPQRRGLQELLEGFGTALTYEPTAADDADQPPEVQGETAARALNDAFRTGGRAGKGTAIVNTALLGKTRHDLSGLVRSGAVVFRKLADREDDLSNLITNFNVFTGALAAESQNLSDSVAELAPTLEEAQPSLANLNDALPAVRALAIESRPGIQELPATIAAASPWLDETRGLLRSTELGGLAKLLRGAAPGLAQATAASKGLFQQQTLLSRCTSDVLVPTGDIVIDDQFSTGQPNFNEFLYSAVYISGESQGFDGNGPYVRLQAGGGPVLLEGENPGGAINQTKNFTNSIEAPSGVRPVTPPDLPPFRTDIPCHRNAVPNLNGPAGATGPPDLVPAGP